MDLYFQKERILGTEDITSLNGTEKEVLGFDEKGWLKPVEIVSISEQYNGEFDEINDGIERLLSKIALNRSLNRSMEGVS